MIPWALRGAAAQWARLQARRAAAALALLAVVGCGPAGEGREQAATGNTAAAPASDAAAVTEGPDGDAPDVGGTAPVPTRSNLRVPKLRTYSARLEDLETSAEPAPTGLRVDAIDVRAPVAGVGLDREVLEMALPPDAATVAWYRLGAAPGDTGSAVLAAHVDYAGQQGAFFRLAELTPGDDVTVTHADGSDSRWRVVDRRSYRKQDLPVDTLFKLDGPPTLTLITCGGFFDANVRHYRDNIVVRAVPAPA